MPGSSFAARLPAVKTIDKPTIAADFRVLFIIFYPVLNYILVVEASNASLAPL
jgi:hypothetical protein